MELVQASISCPLRHGRRTEDCADQALVGSVLRHTNYGHAEYLEKLDDNVYRMSDTMGDMMYIMRIRNIRVLSPNRLPQYLSPTILFSLEILLFYMSFRVQFYYEGHYI